MKRWHCIIIMLSFSALLYGGLLIQAPRADAGYFKDLFNGVKQLTELPSEVNELKENYQITLDKLGEAQATLDQFQQQNLELIERNKELTATVNALTEAEQAREATSRKTRVLILTGVGLVAGYFILLRGLRLILRR
jgi:predicted PurR-regulated permease PerM